ncbi:MAG: DNA mismatch repair endonuclease MutL [Anaerolineales bacterium]
MPIHLLPEEIASQIAAGEVVERPASVVKELVENALDAGAHSIQVRIEEAGQRLIEISDDGHGIPAEELPLAVTRHATSKLYTAEDLFHIVTLGFRGEALASIASVSRFTIVSRPPQAPAGARLRVEGGHAGTVEPVGAPPGTLVRVEDLFYNVPARRKFLKKPVTERRQIDALLTRYALAYPNVRFALIQDDRLTLQTSGNGECREALAALYGLETARRMLPVQALEGRIRVDGYISPTDLTAGNRQGMLFFVNGRPVQDATLIAALLRAYHTLLMVGRYPYAVLFLEMPPEDVDVNVHPTKAEVRFHDKDSLFRAVQGAARRALLAHTPIPDIQVDSPYLPPQNASPFDGRPSPWDGAPAWGGAEADSPAGGAFLPGMMPRPESESAPPAPEGQPHLPGAVPLLRLVGQIASAYLVAEGPDGLYLIDQHAAHERVLFERFMAQRDERLPAQVLLEPVSVTLPPEQARLLEGELPALAKLGFQVEEFGRNTFLVRALPVLLAKMEPAAALRVLVDDFEEDETPLQGQVEAKIIARVCKRAAVKAGQTLSHQEQEALLRDLEACQSPRTCPHGRPTMIHLSVDVLERQFGRRGAR